MTDPTSPEPARETLGEGFDRYNALTAQASGSARNLCLAGIAAVWLLAAGPGGEAAKLSTAPAGFIWAAIAFAAGVALDVAHYAVGGAVLIGWLRSERSVNDDLRRSVTLPERVRRVPAVFYWLKMLATFVGYVTLGVTIAVAYL